MPVGRRLGFSQARPHRSYRAGAFYFASEFGQASHHKQLTHVLGCAGTARLCRWLRSYPGLALTAACRADRAGRCGDSLGR
jgi:hypothetical protein